MSFDVLLSCFEETSKTATVSPLSQRQFILPVSYHDFFYPCSFVALVAGANNLMASTTDYTETFSDLEEFEFPVGCQSTRLQGSVQTFCITLGAIFYRWLSRRLIYIAVIGTKQLCLY